MTVNDLTTSVHADGKALSAYQGYVLDQNKADKTAFTGTDGTSAGTAGLVPGPATTDAGKFLKADGTWAEAGNTYTAGTGISISGSNEISVNYGTSSTTACAGDDSRLSDSRTPTGHASTSTTYGVGSTSKYGHCMIVDNLTSSAYTSGKVLSAYQGYVLDNGKQNKVTASTTDLTPGTSALTTGELYFVYE